jgi:hypothetical protein
MNLPGLSRLRDASVGDVLIILSVVSLVAALLYPTLEARSFGRLVTAAVADVDAVSAAARAAREMTGRWPDGARPGTRPPGLVTLPAGDSVFSRPHYALGWSVWDVVDSVPAPPDTGPPPADAPPDTVGPRMVPTVHRVGAVSVYAGDSLLLAQLSAHYADAAPLILDTMWLMILPERSPAGP